MANEINNGSEFLKAVKLDYRSEPNNLDFYAYFLLQFKRVIEGRINETEYINQWVKE